MFNWVHVQSSVIDAVCYSHQTLYIRFITGEVYGYQQVPESIYQDLLNAPSHGHYFNEFIRDHYDFKHL